MPEVPWLPAYGFKWDTAPTPTIYPQIITVLMSNIKPWHHDKLLPSPWQLGSQKKSYVSVAPFSLLAVGFIPWNFVSSNFDTSDFGNCSVSSVPPLAHVSAWCCCCTLSLFVELHLHTLSQWPHSVQLHWFFPPLFLCYPAGYFISLEDALCKRRQVKENNWCT